MFPRRRKSNNSTRDPGTVEQRLASLSTVGQPLDTSDSTIGPLGLNPLHVPSTPLVELIFVHGLRGGSRKTWSKTKNLEHFWPKEWLSRDPEFKNVRIHSFGYESDWVDTKESVLNIHEFGKSLLAEVSHSPDIRNDGDTPIIFIGHSMGGLVIKKAYILANQDPSTKSLANRVHSMVFLATPHRGADSATLLNNMLRATVTYGSKPFLSDLERHSSALQSINDEFRHYSNALKLQSFYETERTNIGVSSRLIVNRDSATLGYPNEESTYLNASHRSICKFESSSDSTYISLRNSLVTLIEGATQKVSTSKQKQYRNQLREIQTYLGVSETPEDDLITLEDEQIEGSCQWLTQKKQFQAWRDCYPDDLAHYWLSAPPAFGKSVTAAHVIRDLGDLNADCSYYFFKHNDAGKTSVNGCLRSLAYQMALVNFSIMQSLLDMKDDGVRFDTENELSVWRKLFLGGILEVKLDRPYFWVIDAFDECTNPNNLVSLISKVDGASPLRIFITSRPTAQIAASFSRLETVFYHDEMTVNDTRGDIELYLNANMHSLPLQDRHSCQNITETILEKSRGLFLWVVLVVDEMRSAFSEEDLQRILVEVPPGMDPLYERTLELMSQANRGKHLVQAILRWIVCATRPLTTTELEHALKLDTGESVFALEKFIRSVCGQFVHVDKNGRTSLIHETLRTFLLRQDLSSEFAVNMDCSHGRISNVCLQYLAGGEMAPPRSQKLMHIYRAKAAKRPAFVDYACSHFSQHLRHSHPADEQGFVFLCKIFEKNICSWIEHMALTGNLFQMIRTSKDLKSYLQARAKYHPPIDKSVQFIDSWGLDLVRLATQFGRCLNDSPSAIFWLIPPFCPPMTSIGSRLGSTAHGIIVKGLSSTVWSDRVACIQYRDKRASAIACSDNTFAVSLTDKSIKLYSRSTCQESGQLSLSLPMHLLAFSPSEKLVAASGSTYVAVFNIETGEQLWQSRFLHRCLTLEFAPHDILWLVTQGGLLLSFSGSDGSKLSLVKLTDPFDESRVFSCAKISLDLNMVAAAQRGRPVGLYDLEDGLFYGYCTKGTSSEPENIGTPTLWIRDFVFGPNPAISLLAVLYHDGTIVLFDPYELVASSKVQADADVLSSSPAGRILVTGNSAGTIQIFQFESLQLIYKIVTSDYSIQSLAFSSDGLSFIDIRQSLCNVWEPPVLVHADSGETGSVSDTVAAEPTVQIIDTEDNANITALACDLSGEYVFCGKDDGTVALYSTATGKELQALYKHRAGLSVRLLVHGSKSDLLISSDTANRFMVWKILRDNTWSVDGPLLESRIPDLAIQQLLLDSENERLLISTVTSATIYNVNTAACDTAKHEEKAAWRWINHPRESGKLIHISAESAHIYSWDEFSQSEPHAEIQFASAIGSDMLIQNVLACSDQCCKLCIGISAPRNRKSTSQVTIVSTSSFEEPFPDPITPLKQFSKISLRVNHVIGCLGRNLIFLDHRMWICSLDLESFENEYYQHCYIPDDWLSSNWNLIIKVTTKGDLVFVKQNEIAVIKRALNQKDTVVIEPVSS